MRFARVLLLVALAATVAAVSLATTWLNRPLALAGETAEYSVEPGKTSREIADGWVRAGVQTSPFLLYQWFRWSGRARQIRAGSYEISAGTTPIRLLDKMVRGDETLATVRFTEGWTFRQIRAELARAEGLKPTIAAMSDDDVMTALGAAGISPEGRFHPDTYTYSKGSTDVALLKRAYRAMAKRLADAWQERDPNAIPRRRCKVPTRRSRWRRSSRRRPALQPIAAASPACSSTGCESACRCRPTRR
jgi:UPF0755 protein